MKLRKIALENSNSGNSGSEVATGDVVAALERPARLVASLDPVLESKLSRLDQAKSRELLVEVFSVHAGEPSEAIARAKRRLEALDHIWAAFRGKDPDRLPFDAFVDAIVREHQRGEEGSNRRILALVIGGVNAAGEFSSLTDSLGSLTAEQSERLDALTSKHHDELATFIREELGEDAATVFAKTARRDALPNEADADDLTVLDGIGSKLAKRLNDYGVRHCSQIADWSKSDIDKVEADLGLKGRIERDSWVSQARKLRGDQ